MYGLQYQRSYSTGVIVAGSRSEKASAGFVSALTSKRRYWPGRLAKILRDFQRREDGVVFAASGGNDARDRQRVRAAARIDFDSASGVQIQTLRERNARHAFFGTIRKPSAVDAPPRISSGNSRRERAAVGNWNRVAVPRADQFLVRICL